MATDCVLIACFTSSTVAPNDAQQNIKLINSDIKILFKIIIFKLLNLLTFYNNTKKYYIFKTPGYNSPTVQYKMAKQNISRSLFC